MLRTIGIQSKAIKNELRHYDHIQFGKTASRRILGSMNDMAWQYQAMAEDATSKKDLSLSDAEIKLSQMPCKPINYRFPCDIARELLAYKTKNAS